MIKEDRVILNIIACDVNEQYYLTRAVEFIREGQPKSIQYAIVLLLLALEARTRGQVHTEKKIKEGSRS